jgi:putative DNA primase/helicase
MTAESIAKALGGHRAGATWMARCPAHEDRVPSLSISSGINGKVLVRCHAGCDQRDVIVILRQRGLWETTGRFWVASLASAKMAFPINPTPTP